MSVLDRAAGAVTARMLAWAILIVLVLLGLLGLSIAGNVRQWADHRAYVKSEGDRLQSAAMKAGLQVAASIAKQKQKDDPRLIEAVSRIEARVAKLQGAQRPAPLPAQCAPGKQRMDAVNAGADP
ncbi:hypothetical protein LJB71_08305 [Thermomonas sp. S9]|uniref:hypothetical protein n=1 Tax=Thermomonas sp. S9 TaxID=2885203 RepID=UPI00216B6296|nr:hypothetical protein [Thermomonas sp. S9]MCR6496217.1 hypothetical protein [Thermomonas sp. S9]